MELTCSFLEGFRKGEYAIYNNTDQEVYLEGPDGHTLDQGEYCVYTPDEGVIYFPSWPAVFKSIKVKYLSDSIKTKEPEEECIDLDTYQSIIEKTAIYPEQIGMAYCAMGLSGEAGEVTEKIKKLYRDHSNWDEDGSITTLISMEYADSIKKELGDVIWYVTALANEFRFSLREVLESNYEKLTKRKKTNTLSGSGDNREEV